MNTADRRIEADPQRVATACAAYILKLLSEAVKGSHRASFAISGGHTPAAMFAELARSGFDWGKVHIFFVDERCVPPSSDQSNFKLANDSFFTPAAIPAGNVHRILGEEEPDEAARKYVADIQTYFSLGPAELPVFDVLHRGMGPDAHTASLFPGEPLIKDRTGIAAHVWVEKMSMDRVTLLPGVLLAAENTVLQVVGPDKADAAFNVLCGPEDPMQYPCQIATRGSAGAVWFMDEQAAAKIKGC